MYRIKGSQRKAFYLLLFFSLVWREVTAQTTTYHKAESFLFSFKENSDLFLADYGDNAYQLERMGQLLDASRNRLLKGDNHLLIVSHVDAYGYEEDAMVNEASLRASRIRAYLKTRFDIPHDCVAFYIDRSGSYRDQIHIYNVYCPLPWFANISIHYSESRYPIAVRQLSVSTVQSLMLICTVVEKLVVTTAKCIVSTILFSTVRNWKITGWHRWRIPCG